MRDPDVRRVLLDRLNDFYEADPTTIVVEELGLRRGTVRADVAVVNGCLKGYEIKSDRDTLRRLARQSEVYGKVFDTVTLLVGESHIHEAEGAVPSWWGIEVARSGESSSGVYLAPFRSECPNPGIEPLDIVQLLWRDEVLSILSRVNSSHNLANKSRKYLWEALVDLLPLEQLKDVVRETLKSRTRWRAVGEQTPGDEMSQPSAKSSDCLFQQTRSRSRRYIHRPN
jgi:hypothetical protein